MFSAEKKATPEEMATAELKILHEFVQTHYSMTGEGAVFYKCPCQYPDSNCSSLQHHPDLDVVIMATQLPDESEAVQRPPSLLPRETYLILSLSAFLMLTYIIPFNWNGLGGVALMMILLISFFSYLWIVHGGSQADPKND